MEREEVGRSAKKRTRRRGVNESETTTRDRGKRMVDAIIFSWRLCLCVCVRERERERETDRQSQRESHLQRRKILL